MNDTKIHLYDDEIGKVEYVQHMGTDLTIVNAARVSFGKEKSFIDEKDERLISYLARHKHTSTFEHNVVTFRFTVPLFVRSQHHRHRTWSYNEISRRYTDVDIQFYEPKQFRTQHKTNRQASNTGELINPSMREVSNYLHPVADYTASHAFAEHNRNSLKLYERLLESGVCREQARATLPQSMYTQYYGTANLSNIFKFVGLRLHEGAQWEIQRVASAVLDITENLYPIATRAYKKGWLS